MRRVGVLLAAFAAAIVVAPSAGAKPHVVRLAMTINSSAPLSSDGFTAAITGTVTCGRAYRFSILINLVQASSGAIATGAFPGPLPTNFKKRQAIGAASLCKGKPRPWTVPTESKGKVPQKLFPSSALVCAIVRVHLAKPPGSWLDETSECTTVTLHA
jgi:hypothetical protein